MAINFKKMFGKDNDDEYVEIDLKSIEPQENKVIVKPFVLKDYEGMDEIVSALRTGYTIAVIDIKYLKSKDLIELKRAVSKIKKTVDAMEGTIAGFGDNIVIATPKFANIHKPKAAEPKNTRKDDLW